VSPSRRPVVEAPAPTTEWESARGRLAESDPLLGGVIEEFGPVDPYDWGGRPLAGDDLFRTLTLHIVGQLISRSAASTIFRRLSEMVGGTVDPWSVAASTSSAIQTAGMTRAKARSIHNLARSIVEGIVDLESLRKAPDDEVRRRLTAMPGIGPWSAEMFLLRGLRRPDAFLAGDHGVRKGISRLEKIEMPRAAQARRRASVWAPYRSYAAAYLWRVAYA
jgi:DNA-3-methyladenine glycosylase II